MPEIPTYGDRKVSTRPLDTPLINPGIASAEAFGVNEKLSRIAVAEGAGRLAQGIAEGNRLRQVAIDQRNTTNVMDAVNRYRQADTPAMVKHLNTTGKDAIGLTQRAEESHRKARDEVSATLKSPEEKEMFNSAVDRVWTDKMGIVGNHEADQIKKYQVNTFASAIELDRQAALDSGDQAMIHSTRARQQSSRDMLASMTGQDAKSLQLDKDADDDKLFGGHVQSLLDKKQTAEAVAFFNANKDNIHGEVRKSLEKTIATNQALSESQAEAEAIYSPDKTTEEMMIEADKIEDQPKQAATKQRLQEMTYAKEKSDKQKSERLTNDILKATNVSNQGMDTPGVASQWDRLNEVDPAAALSLRDSLARKAAGKTETTEAGFAVMVNMRSALSGALGEDAKKDAIADGPSRYLHMLSRQDADALFKLVDDAKLSKQKTDQQMPKGILSNEERVNAALTSIEVPTGKDKDGNYSPVATRLRIQVDKKMRAEKNGGEVSPERVQEIVDELLYPVTLPDPIFYNSSRTKTIHSFEFDGADKTAYSPAQMPKAHREVAIEELAKQGNHSPTDAQIMNAYNVALADDARKRAKPAAKVKTGPAKEWKAPDMYLPVR